MAAAPPKLRVNIQTDRLPNVDGGAKAQIALRLSAAVEDSSDLPSVANLVHELLPWKWLQTGGASWDPHDPASWKIWRIDGTGTVTQVSSGSIARAVTPPAGFDATGDFINRLDSDIDSIVNSIGADAAMGWPGDGSEVSGRTVFGAVEGLTALPHPIPAATKVFTALTISPLPDENDVFVAVPLFKPAIQGSYLDPADPVVQADPNGLLIATADVSANPADKPIFENCRVVMRPSLSWKVISTRDDQQLIDLAKMLIAKPDTTREQSFEDDDWAASLARRVADAVDPSARLLSVLDQTITDRLNPANADAAALRRCLVNDLAQTPSRFLKALDSIAWAVAGPRIEASPMTMPPSAIMLDGLAARDPARWPEAIGHMLAHAQREATGLPDAPGRTYFASVPARRIAGVLGLPTNPVAPDLAEREAAAINTDEGLLGFAARHWLGGFLPKDRFTVAAGTSIDLAAQWRAATPDQPAIDPPPGSRSPAPVPAPSPAPLLDLQRAFAAATGASDVAFEISLKIPATDFSFVIAFARAAAGPGASVKLGAKAADTKIEITVEGLQTESVQIDRKDELTLTVKFALAAGLPIVVTLSAGVEAMTTNPVPATAALMTGPLYITLAAADSDVEFSVPASDQTQTALRAAFDRNANPQGVRADLSLSFLGPFFHGIMAGRLTWNGPQPSQEISDAAAEPLPKRLTQSIAALVGDVGSDADPSKSSLYGMLLKKAIAAAQLDPTQADDLLLIDLLTNLIDNARGDAVDRARTLIPQSNSGKDAGRRLTTTALPITFRIDQLRNFAGNEDLWTRLAGLGVLISRTSTYAEVPTTWWTLNVATLHIPTIDGNGRRADLGEDNAVAVTQAGWPAGSIVDPVAMQVGETDGVRSALISYDNRSLVAEMVTDAELDQPSGGIAAMVRRIEAFAFPPTPAHYLLPALSFGYAYHVLPYLIGQGGTLPPILRQTPDDPLTRKDAVVSADGSYRIKLESDPTDYRRTALNRRTRPVGAPRLAGDKLRGVPEGVPPLAMELPIRPPPVTIGPGVDGRFFVDKEGRAGVLDFRPPAGDDKPGFRFEIGGIQWGAGGAGQLSVKFTGRDAAGNDVAVQDVLPAVTRGRVRIELFDDSVTREYSDEQQDWTEDAFKFEASSPLDPALKAVAGWRSVSIQITADKELDLEPPIVAPIVRVKLKDGTYAPSEVVGKSRIAPESGHQSRTVTMIDGIGIGPFNDWRSLTVDIKRPSIDFGNYGRWINAPLFEAALGAAKTAVRTAVNKAHSTTSQVGSPNEDRTLDDPAVTALFAELVRIFPDRRADFPMTQLGASLSDLADVLGFDANGGRRETKRQITVQLANGNEGLNSSTASVVPGCIYELRVYAAVPENQPQISLFDRVARLSPPVRAIMRKCPIDRKMHLASPLVLTIEVATEKMPGHLVIKDADARRLDVALARPPSENEDKALVRLSDDFVRIRETYPSMRYCQTASLISQRWSWRGRPLDDLWPRFGASIRDRSFDSLFDVAFSDRRDDDVGEITERRLERVHAYGGRERRDQTTTPSLYPTLFERSLEWKGGANLWRYAVRMSSRYAKMRPGNAAFAVNSHLQGQGAARWQNEIVLDRSVGRQPKRPGLALVLPLTEPIMAHGAVPPLLTLFNDRLFPNFHIGDGIEVAIEIARHPFPLIARLKHEMATVEEAIRVFPTPQNEDQEAEKQRLVNRLAELTVQHDSIKPHTLYALKYLQEQAPDAVRTGESADGTILPLRLDGPIGYTFDLKTEAGRFDHAGILITPIHQELTPWSMVKLRFRRHEAPEGLDATMELTKDGAAPNSGGRPSEPQSLKPGKAVHYRLVNNRGLMGIPPSRTEIVFPTEHEGLIVDIPKTSDLGAASKVRISFVGEIKAPGPKPPLDQHYVEVACNRDLANGLLTLRFLTDLGDAGEWTVPVKDGATATIRLVLSARDKPETGNKFEPAGDVAVHVRLTRSDAIDAIDKAEENRWLAVACIPLISTRVIGVDDPFVVEVLPTLPAQADAVIAPIRLSTFTPGLWCQFAEAMSLFNATFANGEKAMIAASDLRVTITGTIATVAASTGGLRTLSALVPPETETDGSQIEELLVAIVTRYVRDVFDRLREQPVAVKLWDPDAVTLDLSSPDWPPRPKKEGAVVPLVAGDLGATGRLRFLKILRAKTRERGGFLDEEAVFPQAFFEPGMLGVATDINPPDAKGLILGFSMPIEWTRKT